MTTAPWETTESCWVSSVPTRYLHDPMALGDNRSGKWNQCTLQISVEDIRLVQPERRIAFRVAIHGKPVREGRMYRVGHKIKAALPNPDSTISVQVYSGSRRVGSVVGITPPPVPRAPASIYQSYSSDHTILSWTRNAGGTIAVALQWIAPPQSARLDSVVVIPSFTRQYPPPRAAVSPSCMTLPRAVLAPLQGSIRINRLVARAQGRMPDLPIAAFDAEVRSDNATREEGGDISNLLALYRMKVVNQTSAQSDVTEWSPSLSVRDWLKSAALIRMTGFTVSHDHSNEKTPSVQIQIRRIRRIVIPPGQCLSVIAQVVDPDGSVSHRTKSKRVSGLTLEVTMDLPVEARGSVVEMFVIIIDSESESPIHSPHRRGRSPARRAPETVGLVGSLRVDLCSLRDTHVSMTHQLQSRTHNPVLLEIEMDIPRSLAAANKPWLDETLPIASVTHSLDAVHRHNYEWMKRNSDLYPVGLVNRLDGSIVAIHELVARPVQLPPRCTRESVFRMVCMIPRFAHEDHLTHLQLPWMSVGEIFTHKISSPHSACVLLIQFFRQLDTTARVYLALVRMDSSELTFAVMEKPPTDVFTIWIPSRESKWDLSDPDCPVAAILSVITPANAYLNRDDWDIHEFMSAIPLDDGAGHCPRGAVALFTQADAHIQADLIGRIAESKDTTRFDHPEADPTNLANIERSVVCESIATLALEYPNARCVPSPLGKSLLNGMCDASITRATPPDPFHTLLAEKSVGDLSDIQAESLLDDLRVLSFSQYSVDCKLVVCLNFYVIYALFTFH